MADTSPFEIACTQLEQASEFDRLVARGTIRVVMKKAGLEPRSASPHDVAVAVERLLPDELAKRGLEDSASLCASIARTLSGLGGAAVRDTPDAIFERLGGA